MGPPQDPVEDVENQIGRLGTIPGEVEGGVTCIHHLLNMTTNRLQEGGGEEQGFPCILHLLREMDTGDMNMNLIIIQVEGGDRKDFMNQTKVF